jgi:methylmalonyl-CoA mutase C-terminal domain/subunit
MEAIYTGLHQTPEMIAQAAIQEDVDVVCISSLSGAHGEIFPEVLRLLKEKNAGDIAVLGGGIIPENDAKKLLAAGVRAVFGSGAPLSEIVTCINALRRTR